MKDCTGKTILNMFTLGKTNLPEEFSFSTLIQHILYHINNNIINKVLCILYTNQRFNAKVLLQRFAKCLGKSKPLRTYCLKHAAFKVNLIPYYKRYSTLLPL